MKEQLAIDYFAGKINDYERAKTEFGIQDITEIVESLENEMRFYFFQREIVFGHTDAKKIFEAIVRKEPYVVMTGIKPTGQYHIGSLLTCNEVLYFQKLGGKVFFCIADMEGYLHNGLSLEEEYQYAIDNIADLLALGLDYKNTYIYKQSEEHHVLKLAALFSKSVTYNMMRAIYGEQSFGAYQSALIQVADILLPQLEEFEGPCNSITPVGLEQAPHSRLARDIVHKKIYQERYKFKLPSFIFHRILGALDGGEKMGKSAGKTFILTLSETPKSLKEKIAGIFTGGRETSQKQKEIGGQPKICRVFDLFKFHFMEKEEELAKRCSDCMIGKILCGECKQDLYNRALTFITKHLEKKEKKMELAKQILDKE